MTIKPRVALMMIVSASTDAEATTLMRALGSVNGYVDEIFIELNAPKGKKIHPKMRQVAEQFTKEVYVHEWKNNFVEARNFIMSKVPKKYDWLLWLDADDILDGPENIIPVASVMPKNVNGVHILYDYQKDEYGNVVVSHWPCRMVRNNGSYVWKSSFDDDEVSVHETLVPKYGSSGVSNNEFKIVHMAEAGHYRESLLRNIELLEGMARRQAQKPQGIDPRILFYLATHYYDAYRFKETKELLYEYLKLSGWAEERSEAHVYMGKLLKMENNLSGARTAFLMGMGENTKNKNAFLELGILEAHEKRWEQASDWLEKGIAIHPPITAMVKFNNDFELLTQYAQALSNLGGKSLSKALKIAQEALKLQPYNPNAVENRDNVAKLVEYRDLMRGTARLLRTLQKDEKEKIIPFLDNLPYSLSDSPVVTEARQFYTPAKTWDRKTMAIYVGQGPLGMWGPWSLNEGGTGGSEEAVVRLSRELSDLGWEVVVYATPGKKAGKDGDYSVDWKQYWEINNKDQFDVLISWRQPAFFDFDWQARKKYLWLHDVMEKEELTPARIKRIDRVIYVSKYHSERPESEHIKQNKKLPSGNGITSVDFEKYDGKFKRDNKRCIYMSANERGLRVLYDIWPDVKKAVPDATLSTYYGWDSFDAINRDNPERMAWKASMTMRAKELGIEQSKKIDHNQINEEIFKSGIFAYPCTFPEVNCITAQKSMSGGAWPVTSDFAALKDVVTWGDAIDMGEFTPEDIEKYKQALIYRLKHPPTEKERKEMMVGARKKYDWSNTASQWNKEML